MGAHPAFPRFGLSVSRAVRLLIMGAILAIALLGHQVPFVRYLDDRLVGYRFAAAPRAASGQIVYLAIDKDTLDKVGTWPWPRSIHAAVLDKLGRAGVNDIFIDIDFSTPSTLREDERLAAALREAGGGVILPVFKQYGSADNRAAAAITRPMPILADNAWLAFANVALDSDGSIRRFELGDILDGLPTQSIAAVLGKSQLSSGSPLIDYSILPSSVPTISLGNILDPAFDGAGLKGRSVVIGAYATELKDIFPVPVYGQLSGPMLHVLAAETLLQNRILTEADQRPLNLAFAALVIVAVFGLRRRRAAVAVALVLATVLAGELAAFLLQKEAGVVVQTANGWMILVIGLVLLLTEKLDLSRFIAEIANAEQRNIRRLLGKIVADSTDGVLAFDHNLKVLEESDSARAMLNITGRSKGRDLRDLVPASFCELVLDLIAAHDADRRTVRGTTGRFCVTSEGSVRHLEAAVTISPAERPDEAGTDLRAAFIGSLVIRDMTARQLYEERLRYLADYDDLTGLMNRRAFSEHVCASRDPLCVFAIGIHRLGVVNATMGRDIGDELLRAVAKRLDGDGRTIATGRLGGDVFAAAVVATQTTDVGQCAQALVDLFDHPLDIAGSSINVSVRVGVFAGKDENDAGLVEKAEHALDEARAIAGSGWRAYDPTSALQQQKSRQLEHAMRDSLKKGEFFLLYQPQVDLASGALIGAEALMRWQHPQFGMVSPATFIPVAEANGFICELGCWALAQACREAAAWPDDLSVAVNVAPIQLIRGDLVADVRQALAVSGLAASRLHLEITESAFVEHSGPILKAVGELRAMGITIALDDFGTGYSSLSYIAGFPLDKLKIDQSFVRKMATDPQSRAIVQTIKALARGLDLSVVAEGVETQLESDLLRAMGCEVGQGYFYGKPQTSAELLRLADRAPWMSVA